MEAYTTEEKQGTCQRAHGPIYNLRQAFTKSCEKRGCRGGGNEYGVKESDKRHGRRKLWAHVKVNTARARRWV